MTRRCPGETLSITRATVSVSFIDQVDETFGEDPFADGLYPGQSLAAPSVMTRKVPRRSEGQVGALDQPRLLDPVDQAGQSALGHVDLCRAGPGAGSAGSFAQRQQHSVEPEVGRPGFGQFLRSAPKAAGVALRIDWNAASWSRFRAGLCPGSFAVTCVIEYIVAQVVDSATILLWCPVQRLFTQQFLSQLGN